MDQLDNPRWAEVADRCLACSNCTMVCPTCFCTSVGLESDLDGATTRTERRWDSCFTGDFARVAGGNFRPRRQDRYRQWLTHKFATWVDQFGTSGCVGCGRCITWCPVGIDVREELAAIAPPYGRRTHGAAAVIAAITGRLRDGHASRSVRHETADTSTLQLGAGRRRAARRTARPVRDGRAARLPAVPDLRLAGRRRRARGSRSAPPDRQPRPSSRASPGAQVGLRGPLGRGWPIERAGGARRRHRRRWHRPRTAPPARRRGDPRPRAIRPRARSPTGPGRPPIGSTSTRCPAWARRGHRRHRDRGPRRTRLAGASRDRHPAPRPA